MDIANGVKQLPLLFSFFLGVVGAVAPCQLTGNISAITIYGINHWSKKCHGCMFFGSYLAR
ncbi:hypothetical protein [Lentibacillus songyuanensis]|uniref:hypothetical protein n=1 Tax=Lentibacillus songyuanensis TaxID=3136161 RepID=UPI003862076F